MNLLVSNHLILLGLRSFSAISPIWSWILFHESMALTVTENFPKLFVLKDFLWRRPFLEKVVLYIVVNIIAELKQLLKIGGSMLFSALLMKRILSIIVLSLNFRILFFQKKGLEWKFQGWNNIILMAVFCSIIIRWIALEFWAHIRLA